MKTELQSCCLCFNISSETNVVDSDILELLKFVVNVDTSAFENSAVCDSCLNKIKETYEYKRRNSSKMLVETKKEINSEVLIMCQKCEKLCEQGDSFPLVDCVTQIDWSDFVNYLFVDQDSHSLESSQICDSCRISVLNIQDFLQLIYIYDQSKMKYDDNYDEIKVNKNLVINNVEIKKEWENFSVDDKKEINNFIEDNNTEIAEDNHNNSYTNFKCKNEEVELKLEDDDQSTYQYEKVPVGKEMTSRSYSNKNSLNNVEEKQAAKYQGWSNRLIYDFKVDNNIQRFKCKYCSKGFSKKLLLHNHLLRIHKSRDGVTSKIHKCDECNYETAKKDHLLKHRSKHDVKLLNSNSIRGTSKVHECDTCSYETTIRDHLLRHKETHGIPVGLEKYECHSCIYETYNKYYLIRHVKIHHNLEYFKCTVCSKKFTDKRHLDDHLLKVHKNKDSVTSKIHQCDKCNYSTTKKNNLLKHILKHGVKLEGFEQYKCQYCIYETFNKSHLSRHLKIHNNARDFKCALCLKHFNNKKQLNDHFLEGHNNKNSVSSELHECDTSTYETTKKHIELKHDIKVNFENYKCQHCTYETYNKGYLIRHVKIHNSFRDFTCTLCSRNFTERRHLDDHTLKVHKCKDNVKCKIHECDECGYETTIKNNFMKHKLKHGIKVNGVEKYKCQNCVYETYDRSHLIRHMKIHENIRDFKCTLCSKEFSEKRYLGDHLLKVHSDKCSYSNTNELKNNT